MDKVYVISQRVGLIIKYYRKLNQLSLADLAKKIGISQQQQYRYERGDNRISIERVNKYANLFDIDILNLLPEECDENNLSFQEINTIKNFKECYIYE